MGRKITMSERKRQEKWMILSSGTTIQHLPALCVVAAADQQMLVRAVIPSNFQKHVAVSVVLVSL